MELAITWGHIVIQGPCCRQGHADLSGLQCHPRPWLSARSFYTWSSCWWQWNMLTLGAMRTMHIESWDKRWGHCPSPTPGDLALSLDCCYSRRTGPNPHGENWPCPTGRPGPNNPNSGLGRAGLSPHHGCWRADPDGVDTGKFVLPSLELGSPVEAQTDQLSYYPGPHPVL